MGCPYDTIRASVKSFVVIFGYWGNPRLLEKFKAEFEFHGWVLASAQ